MRILVLYISLYPMQTTQIGSRGEQLAAEALSRLGYEILEQNWRTKWAEIDLVAKKNGIIYFVEVKYRATLNQGDGLDYITSQKIFHMQRAAELWVSMNAWKGEHQLLAASVSGLSFDVDIREII